MDRPLRWVLLHRQAELLQPLGGLVELAAGQDMGKPCGLDLGGQPPRVLGEKAQLTVRPDGAARGRELSAQDLEEAGLASTVAAHKPDLVAGADGEGGLGQREAPAHFHAQVAGLEHNSMMAGRPAFLVILIAWPLSERLPRCRLPWPARPLPPPLRSSVLGP